MHAGSQVVLSEGAPVSRVCALQLSRADVERRTRAKLSCKLKFGQDPDSSKFKCVRSCSTYRPLRSGRRRELPGASDIPRQTTPLLHSTPRSRRDVVRVEVRIAAPFFLVLYHDITGEQWGCGSVTASRSDGTGQYSQFLPRLGGRRACRRCIVTVDLAWSTFGRGRCFVRSSDASRARARVRDFPVCSCEDYWTCDGIRRSPWHASRPGRGVWSRTRLRAYEYGSCSSNVEVYRGACLRPIVDKQLVAAKRILNIM
ncbi:hypothetical protein BC628DRAFT_1054390 [Trametes gibbosa]|nr:hypothetical protein BC628DRAFT_1054390 [Trametes gibbosa]